MAEAFLFHGQSIQMCLTISRAIILSHCQGLSIKVGPQYGSSNQQKHHTLKITPRVHTPRRLRPSLALTAEHTQLPITCSIQVHRHAMNSLIAVLKLQNAAGKLLASSSRSSTNNHKQTHRRHSPRHTLLQRQS